MRKRILAYLSFIDMILAHELPVTASFDADGNYTKKAAKDEAPTRRDYEKLADIHLSQIAFFSHERLIHLIVTVLFAILTFAVFLLCFVLLQTTETFSVPLFVLMLVLLVLLVPYVWHYYILENSVQKMYRQYDEIMKQIRQ
ncbi:MAG: hypothetical protein K5697_16455 [Lachnospiraceae bacterium]|nr:hypothetical protein [Lachnospiraceae bacterium]